MTTSNEKVTKKLSPFDYINEINHGKNNLIVDEQTERQYNSFLVNRGLSFSIDTVILANEMNSRPHIPKKMQNDFLLSVVPKKKRYSKWLKADKLDDLEIVKAYYECNDEKAKAALRILKPEQIEYIKAKMFTGGQK